MDKLSVLLLGVGLSFMLSNQAVCVEERKFKDPTEPSEGVIAKKDINTSMKSSEPLDLSIILIAGDHKTAVINNKTVKEGDVVFGNRVIEIGLTSVKLMPEVEKSDSGDAVKNDVVELRLLDTDIKEIPQ